ncbi:hypothetical protein AB1L42_18835 [Thalassoglobus sp. JC818]|uniref:hypothetical protein n=1 Tax=Thalassoglobus sp. JC818 TaxID=3232136 RepID=UPI00345962B2
MRTFVIVFQHLPASELGAYGGSRSLTAFDEFTSCADVYDWVYVADRTHPLTQELNGISRASFRQANSIEEIDDNVQELASGSSSVSTLLLNLPSDTPIAEIDRAFASTLNSWKTATDSNEPTTVVVTANLGEHIDVDALATHPERSVTEAAAHIPLIIQQPGQDVSRRRSRLLTSDSIPSAVRAISESTGSYLNFRDEAGATQIEYQSRSMQAIRTEQALLIRSRESDESGESHFLSLYLKPEDCWEVLDVASQYPLVVEHFLETGELTLPQQGHQAS